MHKVLNESDLLVELLSVYGLMGVAPVRYEDDVVCGARAGRHLHPLEQEV